MLLSFKKTDDRQQNRRAIEILLDVTRTLGRQGIAFGGHGNDDDGNLKQIVKLMARYCPELRHWIKTTRLCPNHVTYLSAQSQNEFIKLIGHEVQQSIIQDANMYSVMAHTTPDVSHKDRPLPVDTWIEWVSPHNVWYRFVKQRTRLVRVEQQRLLDL